MIALKAAGAIGDDGRRDRENLAGGRERKKKRKRKREAKSERGRNGGGERQKERGEVSKIMRKRRTVIRVDEPWTFALFAEFTHYRNTLLVPMVRSGPSGSVVHGGPRTVLAEDTRCRNILYDFGLSCPGISEKINEAVLLVEIGANNDYRKREIIAIVRSRTHSHSRRTVKVDC